MRTSVAADGGDGVLYRQREDETATAQPTTDREEQVVLVVDDEASLADSIAIWLDQRWDARVAHDGSEALEKFGPHVDAVLLDRRMPAVSGDEVLERIRDRDDDTPVAMMTAVDPDWSILDMDFDIYLKKPVTHDDVANAVEKLLACAEYSEALRALFATGMKAKALEQEYPPESFRQADQYEACQSALRRLREQVGGRVEELDADAPELRAFIDDVIDGS